MHASLLEVFDDVKQMADRASQAVQTDYDEHVTGGKILQQFSQDRPCARRAGTMFLMYPLAARSSKRVHLSVMHLVVGRNASITDQSSGQGGGTATRSFCHGILSACFRDCVQIRNA